jgi:hypothetical protein
MEDEYDADKMKWGHSRDGEHYDICDTREDAIAEAGGSCYLAQMRPMDWAAHFEWAMDVDNLIENVVESAYDDFGGEDIDEYLDATQAQKKELENKLKATCVAWLEEHKLRYARYYVAIENTVEHYIMPEEIEA